MGTPNIGTVLGILSILLGALSIWLGYRALLKDRSRGRPRCPKCWYDMQGSPTLVCSECGFDAKTRQRLFKTRRSRRAVVVATGVLLLAGYVLKIKGQHAVENGSLLQAAIPTTVYIAIFPWLGENNQLAAVKRFGRPDASASGVAWQWQEELFARQLARAINSDPDFLATPAETARLLGVLSCNSEAAARESISVIRSIKSSQIASGVLLDDLQGVEDPATMTLLAYISLLEIDDRRVQGRAVECLCKVRFAHLAELTDEQLQHAIEQLVPGNETQSQRFSSQHARLLDRLLVTAITRRERMKLFLAKQVERVAKLQSYASFSTNLVRAWRLCEGNPDPMMIAPVLPIVAIREGEPAIVEWEIANLESHYPQLLALPADPNAAKPRSEHIRLTIKPGHSAAPLPHRESPRYERPAAHLPFTISTAEPHRCRVDLEQYVAGVRAKTVYTVMLEFHPTLPIAELDTIDDLLVVRQTVKIAVGEAASAGLERLHLR